ncbi:hypothetical protein RUM43_010299 [Polyplax serrata]|uniref:Uncharacterized protein n=1 Tax=Polyplax serrata TaxID=468196 RepID=A0AAN8Q4J0_POLSC
MAVYPGPTKWKRTEERESRGRCVGISFSLSGGQGLAKEKNILAQAPPPPGSRWKTPPARNFGPRRLHSEKDLWGKVSEQQKKSSVSGDKVLVTSELVGNKSAEN